MNKFDKYYLKQGKLELSILDDDDEKIEKNIHHEDSNREPREPRIKLTEDIYNTLQTMGKFLTKKVGDEEIADAYEECEVFNASEGNLITPSWNKFIKGESIKSKQATELEEAVKSVYAKAAEEIEGIDVKLTKPAIVLEEAIEPQIEEKQEISAINKMGIFEDGDHEKKELAQSSIDQILFEFFGSSEPQYEYAKRLKRHIDKKIALIENYQ